MQVNGVIFDMDGLLVNSEPLWRATEVRVFAEFGLELSEEDCKETTGLRIGEACAYRAERGQLMPKFVQAAAERIVQEMQVQLQSQGQLLSGARECLEYFKRLKLPIGLASSSEQVLIDTVVRRFELEDFFTVACSAEKLPLGKPHPQVYLDCCQALDQKPWTCLSLEDSLNGMIAAKAARMQCFVVPEEFGKQPRQFALADAVLESLRHVPEAFDELLRVGRYRLAGHCRV